MWWQNVVVWGCWIKLVLQNVTWFCKIKPFWGIYSQNEVERRSKRPNASKDPVTKKDHEEPTHPEQKRESEKKTLRKNTAANRDFFISDMMYIPCYIARILLLFGWLGIILTPAFLTIGNTQSKYHSDPSINSKRKEHSQFLRCFVIAQLLAAWDGKECTWHSACSNPIT